MSDPSPRLTLADGGDESGEQSSTATSRRRPKASKSEMQRREALVLRVLKERGPLDIYTLSDVLELSYSQTVTLVTGMVKEGSVIPSGKMQKKTTYSHRVHQAPMRVDAVDVTELPAVPMTDLISHLHPGATFELVGFHQHNDHTCLDLRTDGREFSVLLAASAA
jgi:hypothetical protein